MSTNDVILTPQILPPNTGYPQTMQQCLNLIVANIIAGINPFGSLFAFGFATPPVDQQNRPWIRTNADGSIAGLYSFVGGVWIAGNIGGFQTGMIMAFNGAITAIQDPFFACTGVTVVRPSGSYTTPNLQSKFIVGTGQGSGLSLYSLGQTGGEETHALIGQEIPDLTIPYSGTAGAAGSINEINFAGTNNAPLVKTTNTSGQATGNGHNNLPPYYALAFMQYIQPN